MSDETIERDDENAIFGLIIGLFASAAGMMSFVAFVGGIAVGKWLGA